MNANYFSAFQVGLQGLGTAADLYLGGQSLQAQIDADAANLQAQFRVISQNILNARKQAEEQRSDTMRAAADEMGRLTVAVAEMGASGASRAALAAEIGYAEGQTLGRIDDSLESAEEAYRSEADAAKARVAARGRAARQEFRALMVGGVLNSLGAGLGGYVDNQIADQQAQNAERRQQELLDALDRSTGLVL